MEIDFAKLFTDGASVLEVYLCPEAGARDGEGDVAVGWRGDNSVRSAVRYGTPTTLQEFYYRDLICSYDKSNDSQKVVRKVMTKSLMVGNLLIAAFIEDQVPAYMFPTTQDIAHAAEITRRSFRVNNRLYITNDRDAHHDYYYIKYTHNENVEVTKMKADLNTAIQKLGSFVHT
jgi:hypothetical protein